MKKEKSQQNDKCNNDQQNELTKELDGLWFVIDITVLPIDGQRFKLAFFDNWFNNNPLIIYRLI